VLKRCKADGDSIVDFSIPIENKTEALICEINVASCFGKSILIGENSEQWNFRQL
jgi:hypothetical protein